MLFSLIEKLPIDVVGATVLHYLDIKDIVRLERACGSKSSHQHFLNLIPHSPAIKLTSSNQKDIGCFAWFAKRNCKIKYLTITLPGKNPALQVKNLQVENLDLCLQANLTMECCNNLFESHFTNLIRSFRIFEDQIMEVIDQLNLLTGKVETLKICNSNNYNDWLNKDILTRWKLKEIILKGTVVNLSTIALIVQTCSDLTTISLNSSTVDDAVVMVVAQHCPNLEKLNLHVHSGLTYHSFVALSERGLPLKELSIPRIPNIPSADISKRCSHALSRIRTLNTSYIPYSSQAVSIFLPYMTGLTNVDLTGRSLSYIPLLTQYCHKLTEIEIDIVSLSVTEILSLCCANPLLHSIYGYNCCGLTDTVLIELIHACPHLHTLYLPNEINISDIVILALSEHCPQLQFLVIRNSTQVTERAVLHLLQCCHKLTRLGLSSSSLSEETWTQLDKNTQKKVSRCD